MLYTPSWSVVSKKQVIGNDYLPKVYAAAKKAVFAGNLGDRMIKDFSKSNSKFIGLTESSINL